MANEPETKMIQATVGPYAGQRLTVAAADADQAIADGWAIDPFAPPGEPAPDRTEDERMKMLDAAHKAARKLRGEVDEGETADAKGDAADTATSRRKPASKAMQAEQPAKSEYLTRSAKK